MKRRTFVTGVLATATSGCVGTTGGELLELRGAAAGPSDAAPGAPLEHENGLGYHIALRRALLFVGGVYLNRARPTSVARDTSCTLAGIYVAQVAGGREIDLLSPEPQPFREAGLATSERALTGEVWLTDGDVDAPRSERTILRIAGEAARGGRRYPFTGELSVGASRLITPTDPALPGQHPICKQRIVSPIPLDLVPRAGHTLLLRVDPRGMLANVDFAALRADGGVHHFADRPGVDAASDNLYAGLRRPSGVYAFSLLEET